MAQADDTTKPPPLPALAPSADGSQLGTSTAKAAPGPSPTAPAVACAHLLDNRNKVQDAIQHGKADAAALQAANAALAGCKEDAALQQQASVIAMMNPRTGAFDGQPSQEQQPCRRRPGGSPFAVSDMGDVVFGALSASNPQVVTAFRGRIDNVALYNFTDGAPPDTCVVEP
ncbi:MAG: hypothetical protein HY902_15250 [Deltaproteobacteria bacterium]|nr:hypothetical protein [Deltaproteobacteria bacterium]